MGHRHSPNTSFRRPDHLVSLDKNGTLFLVGNFCGTCYIMPRFSMKTCTTASTKLPVIKPRRLVFSTGSRRAEPAIGGKTKKGFPCGNPFN